MTKIVYLDCPTGIAGDMCLGALVDVGVPLDYLRQHLDPLGLAHEYTLEAEPVKRGGQLATKVHVHLAEASHTHRHLPDIQNIIKNAQLPPRVTTWSLQIFERLAIAESAVHGLSPETVHFHEVGAIDAIVDIVGTCLGLDWLEIDELYCSALPKGGGTVKSAHGVLSVPVPAVLKLWEQRQVPVYSNGIEKELVTPTGAAITTTLVKQFGPMPDLQVQKIGLGAGTKELSLPNALRLWVGETTVSSRQTEMITVLETQIDDMSPQGIAYTCEQLLEAGALDVFTQPVTMKKSRTGLLLTVICFPELASTCESLLFRETTTLGIRFRTQPRHLLHRELHTVMTPYGQVRVKIARQGDNIMNVHPEYEDCAKLAQESGQPWQMIHQLALEAAGSI
ncbi:nickel pincer cofactor biosynthesis protein LarC [Spirulina sp. CS-785/01]|uniref:nickel pincer cofactor biosynthesis protein LarC n=1 Tax=Spirulina sp. CS-785/01 TaxID=3021716 RepID=UPI00232E338E|nr:nickel pincer cofactor biosynthesis protein LarC [Spirulina sp. CS-785/01]MDB9315307.1 nickel pincer cofactor biosynthesis protein LarC [Spirulina sp. CS-785/01]